MTQQDDLQIALEHHRAGRLREAEAGYRAALARDANDPDATHWLGVLALQAGRAADAVPLLERAAAARPDDAAFQHNLGQAYLSAGRGAEAVGALERARAMEPGRAETQRGLALALLARNEAGDAEGAVAALRRALEIGPDSAELRHHLCAALVAAGRFAEAIAEGQATIDKDPGRLEVYRHLALAYRGKGDPASAKSALATLLQMQPGYAPAWHGVAVIEAEAGNLDDAAILFRKAIETKPDYAPAYQGLSQVFLAQGKQREALEASAGAARVGRGERPPAMPPPLPEAVAALEARLTPSAELRDLHFALAAKHGVFPPGQIPLKQVADLFDKYAGHFDEHLRDRLGYHVPEMIRDYLAAHPAGRPLDVLDLGCGTGLVGELLRPVAGAMWGVDLSGAMIDKARARGVYDHLEAVDLVVALRDAGRTFDLIVAADVLIYTGDFAPVFEAVVAALSAGGRFVFSTEAGPGERYQMNPKSLRFTHAKSYVQRLARMYGLVEESIADITVRVEAGDPVAGHLVVLRKDG